MHKRSWQRTLTHLLIAGAAFLPGAAAEPLRLELDPDRTEIRFVLQATGHQVKGTMGLHSGRIDFDPELGTAAGEIRLELGSARTGNEGRDEKMHEQVFETAKHPDLVFRAERFEGRLEPGLPSKVELAGTIEIHGSSHPLRLHAEVVWSDEGLRGKTAFQIPYVQWGLKDPSVFVLRVAKEVEVEVDLFGSVERLPRDEG